MILAKSGEPKSLETRTLFSMKMKYIALTISLVAFAVGFSDAQENMLFWLGRPIGAIAMVAFFIGTLLEKEYAIYDQQNPVETANCVKSKTKPEQSVGVLAAAAR